MEGKLKPNEVCFRRAGELFIYHRTETGAEHVRALGPVEIDRYLNIEAETDLYTVGRDAFEKKEKTLDLESLQDELKEILGSIRALRGSSIGIAHELENLISDMEDDQDLFTTLDERVNKLVISLQGEG